MVPGYVAVLFQWFFFDYSPTKSFFWWLTPSPRWCSHGIAIPFLLLPFVCVFSDGGINIKLVRLPAAVCCVNERILWRIWFGGILAHQLYYRNPRSVLELLRWFHHASIQSQMFKTTTNSLRADRPEALAEFDTRAQDVDDQFAVVWPLAQFTSLTCVIIANNYYWSSSLL